MTNIIYSDEVLKDCDSDDLENILRSLVDENGICRACGQDHSFTGKEKMTSSHIDGIAQEVV
jgi:hypothetical protein